VCSFVCRVSFDRCVILCAVCSVPLPPGETPFAVTIKKNYNNKASQSALRPLLIQWVPGGVLSVGVQRPGREADHSPSSSTKDNNGEAIPPLADRGGRFKQ
jgi:hypothetical protein